MNQKGFTLVEILAAITILGILAVLTIGGYTRYIEYARQKSYKFMAKSVSTAAEEYVIDNPGAAGTIKTKTYDGKAAYIPKNAPKIEFKELLEEGYLSGAEDPANRGHDCKGAVQIGLYTDSNSKTLNQYVYYVDVCCAAYQRTYIYSFVKEADGSLTTFEKNVSLAKSTCNGYSS